jgi:hypothetical protein
MTLDVVKITTGKYTNRERERERDITTGGTVKQAENNVT